MDDDLIGAIEPEAFAGMTEKQAQKLKPAVVKNFSEKQVQEIDPLALNSMPARAFSAIEDQLTGQQLADVAAINNGVDVNGPPETDPSFVPAGPPGTNPGEAGFVPPVSTPSEELGTSDVDPLADNVSNIVSEVSSVQDGLISSSMS